MKYWANYRIYHPMNNLPIVTHTRVPERIIDSLIYSKTWVPEKDEHPEAYQARRNRQLKQYGVLVRSRGQCYVVQFGDRDVRPMWENQISIVQLVKEVSHKFGVSYDCPLCQPYDPNDEDTERRYITKIVHPHFPEGFIDKGGVWMKCACTSKGKKFEMLKFKNRRK